MSGIEDLNKSVNQGLSDFWGNASRPVNYKTPSKEDRLKVKNPSSGATATRSDRSWSENIAGQTSPAAAKQRADAKATADRMSNRPVGNADGSTTRPEKTEAPPLQGNTTKEKSQLEKFQEYLATIDPGDYDYKKSITDAFAKVYASLDGAANTARTNKDASSKAVQGLAEGGSNLVKKDAGTYQKITDDTARTNNSIYSGQVAALQGDRSKEMAERANFVEKLGIKEAGMGTAGSTQTSAINEALGTQSRSADRINQYGQADQALNNSRAQSILNEGTTRQAGLEAQLSKILGGIDSKRADVGVQEAQAMQQGEQAAYANQLAKFQAGLSAYDKQIENEFKTRDQMMQEAEFQAKYGGGGMGGQGQALTPTGSQAADAYIASQGEDPNKYRSFITNFMAELANDPNVRTNQVNEQLVRGQLLQQAMESGLDPNKVNIMWEYQNEAPVKYMKQNQLSVG